MAKPTGRRQVEVEAIGDDDGESEVSPPRPLAPATNAAAERRAAPRKPVAPATNAAALAEDEAIAPPIAANPAPADLVAAADSTPAVEVSATPPKRKPNPPANGARNTSMVRPAPTSAIGKGTTQRSAVASGQSKPRAKQQAKKSNPNLGLFAGAGVVLVAVVLLVVAAVMNGGKQGAVLAPATPDLPTQAPVAQNNNNNNSGFNIPTIANPNSTESADYGQTPHCVDWAAKVDSEVIRCDVYLGYVQSKDQAYQQQYGSLLNFNSPPGRRALEVLHEDALDELIDEEVAALEAPKEGITVPQSFVDQNMARPTQFPTDASWETSLEANGSSITDVKHLLINGYYDQQMHKLHGTAPDKEEWLKVAHILVASSNQALANSIYQQLQGGADFAALAKQYSIDPLTNNNGGLIGFLNPNNIDTTTGDVMKSLKDGETAKPLGTRKGWEIIRVISRELRPVADPSSLADQSQADFQSWVRPLWTNHTIIKNVTFLPTITPDMSKVPPTYTPDPARGTPYGLTGLNGGALPTPNQTEEP